MEEDPKWVQIQRKTFTRWVNTYLKERLKSCGDLATDLADGILLIDLLEIISSKSLGNYNKKPRIRAQNLENQLVSLKFLQSEGIKLVNIGAEDICDGKIKLILGLIWTIILRYQINVEEGKSARSELLQWVRSKIPEYNILNFTNDWNDGRAICALVNALTGTCPNHRELDSKKAFNNATLGTDLAEKEMGIPKVLAPEDMVSPEVDELSVMTYISYFRDWEGAEGKKKRQDALERTTIPEKSRAYGPGFEGAEIGIPTSFTIESINALGKRVPCGGDNYAVNITGPKGPVDLQVKDNDNGTYTVDYCPKDIGKHHISVMLKDKHISNSPRDIQAVKPPPDASKCKVYGPGVEKATIGEDAPFTVEAYDKAGNPLKQGGDPFEVRVVGPYNSVVPSTLVDNKDGTYSGNYKPSDIGKHTVTIVHKGQHVANSPYTVNANSNDSYPDPKHCKAYGPGLEPGNYDNEPAKFTVELNNSKGERVKNPEFKDLIDVIVSDPSGNELPKVSLKDNYDGTYDVTYIPVSSGPHQVEVMIHNPAQPLYYDHVDGSPFRVVISPGTDAGKSTASGPGLESDKVTDTLPTHFTIQARDALGNPMNRGGDPFDVKIQGPHGPVDAKVKDNKDGTYTVQYQPQEPGKHNVAVTLKDKHIKGSSFTVDVKEGADNDHSFVEGYSFTIRARTKQGTNMKRGGDDFKVKIEGPKGPVPSDKVKVTDHNDGLYTCNYSLPDSGDYKIHVLLNGSHIKGSPWSQNI